MTNLTVSKKSSSLLLAITATLWGLGFVFQAQGSKAGIPAFSFNGVRYLIAAIVVAFPALIYEHPRGYLREKIKRRCDVMDKKGKTTIKMGIIAGVFLLGSSAFSQLGISVTQSGGKAAFISELYIIFVPIFSSLWFVIRSKFKHLPCISVKLIFPIIGTIIATIGLYYLSGGFSGFSLAGDGCLLLGTIAWSFQIIVTGELSKDDQNGTETIYPLSFLCIQFLVCGVLSLMLMIPFGESLSIEVLCAGIVPLLYCALFSGVLAGFLQVFGQKWVTSNYAANIYVIEAVVAVIAEIIFFQKAFLQTEIFGFLFIFLGVSQMMAYDFLLKNKGLPSSAEGLPIFTNSPSGKIA